MSSKFSAMLQTLTAEFALCSVRMTEMSDDEETMSSIKSRGTVMQEKMAVNQSDRCRNCRKFIYRPSRK